MGHGAEQIAHGFPISQTINVYVLVLKSHEQNHQNHLTSNLAYKIPGFPIKSPSKVTIKAHGFTVTRPALR